MGFIHSSLPESPVKSLPKLFAGGALAFSTLACPLAGAIDLGGLANSAGLAIKAATLSDAEVVDLADKSCAALDRTNKVAAPGSKYAKRLEAALKPLNMSKFNGKKLDAKVYLVSEVNAFAMDNGCIRVFAGLMDMMNDDEVRAVVGHEIGHVLLGHSKKSMQTAYSLQAARGAAGAVSTTAATLSQSDLGDLGHKFIEAQFSQSQETDADDQSYGILHKEKLSRTGLVTVFQKLAKLDGAGRSMFSSHPSSPDRAQRMQSRIDKDG
ncbi:M48 family metalloprotease [Pseudoduganella namucuonensis]|uniref:Putative metalloprotease n=1 Tax=Pseudoduganella namucuonensis TaxID=1035707 RepID=A0A1I7L2F1_9BURK|nr:M48 family metalloprotease [Pseudoduganella namucuonensis]SFV03923.1 putative metalloprotease [Pseudoduganella namucuonensis]